MKPINRQPDGKHHRDTDSIPGNKQDVNKPNTGDQDMKDNRESGLKPYFFIGASLLLLFPAMHLRASLSPVFLNPSTINMSALFLFHAYPPNGESVVFQQAFSSLFGNFFFAYVLSALLLIGSAGFAVAGLSAAGKAATGGIPGRIAGFAGKKPLLFCLVIFIAALAILVFLQRSYIGENLTSLDEFSYLFESHVLLKGKLFLESPDPINAYQVSNVINNGKWYSKYTVGFPLLLCAGVLVNMPWIVNCLWGALAAAAIFLAGREIYDGKTGVIAALLLLLSPVFIMNSLVMLPHTSHLFFILLFTFFFFRAIKEKGQWYHGFLCGLSLGFAMLIRPAETTLCALLFFICGIVLIVRQKRKRSHLLKSLILTSLGFGVMLGLLLLINKIQTGEFTTFAFNVYSKGEKIGIGVYEHNLLKGLWNTFFSVSRLFIWIIVAGAELAIVSLFEKKWENRFLFSVVLSTIILYFFYFTIGEVEFGPRYYFVMIGFLLILSSRGIIFIQDKIKEKWDIPVSPAALLVMPVIFSLFAQYPPVLRIAYQHTRSIPHYIVKNKVKKEIPPGEKALVLVRSYPGFTSYGQTTNLPGLKAEVLYLLFLDPETNDEVREKYSDRKIFLLDFDPSGGGFILRPDYNVPFDKRPDDVKVDDLLIASLNYLKSVKDNDEALKYMNKALCIEPGNSMLLLRRATLYMDTEQFDKALLDLDEILKVDPGIAGVYFARGICLEKLGNKKEARESFINFLKSAPNDSNAARAKYWVEYLSGQENGK